MIDGFFTVLYLALAIIILALQKYPLHGLIGWRFRKISPVNWESLGATAFAKKNYQPQGLADSSKFLFLAVENDKRPSVVFKISKKTLKVLDKFCMPDEATHTSGLCYDGKKLWAVDYKSNYAYYIDPILSFKKGKAEVLNKFDTTLKGTSACCLVFIKGISCLVISDFWNSKRTYFVDIKRAVKEKTAANSIIFSYKNGGWSQGLAVDNGFLFESENRLIKGVINKMDLKILLNTGDQNAAITKVFLAPHSGVEDLAISNQRLWLTDEVNFQFFRCKI